MRTRDMIHLGRVALVVAMLSRASVTVAADPPMAPQLPPGFQPHIQPATSGQIDWSAGFILAEGRGIASGTDNQSMLKARRAAELDAAANALAISAGVNLDAGHRTGKMRDGQVRLEGMIKGHQIAGEKWSPDSQPPEYRVTLRVPLWGAQSVAGVFRAEHVDWRKAPDIKRMELPTEEEELAGALIIDARGTDFATCLFPSVACINGVTVYDIITASKRPPEKPPIRYAETDLGFDRLQALGDLPARGMKVYLAAFGADEPPASPLPTPEGSNGVQPVTTTGLDAGTNGAPSASPDPAASPRPKRKRTAVKALRAEGDMHGQLVLTREDAEKLQKDPQAAAMLRNAEIIIVVDSVAAGVQGMAPRPAPDRQVATALATP